METEQPSSQVERGEVDDLEQFDNIRTLAATVLVNYLQHIDGALPELIRFIVLLFGSEASQTLFSK